MELAKHTLTLGRRIVEHHELLSGDLLFCPKPKVQSAEESRELVKQAFNGLQHYITEHAVKFPAHNKGQALRIQIVAPICTVLYMSTMMDTSTTIERVARIVSSLDASGDGIVADLACRETIVQLLTVEILTFDQRDELVVSLPVTTAISEGKPALLGITRHAVGLLVAKRRQAAARKQTRLPPPTPATRRQRVDGVLPAYTSRQLEAMIRERVIGQDALCRLLATRAVLHIERARIMSAGEEARTPCEVLLQVGASGTGKTYSAHVLGRILGLPFFSMDLSTVTEAGYVGCDIEDGLRGLIQAGGGDVAAATFGILHADELDSKCGGGSSVATFRVGVQHNLLRLVEGVEMSLNERASIRYTGPAAFRTDGLMSILSGAFVGWEQIARQLAKNRAGMGFASSVADTRSFTYLRDSLREYGVITTLLNRITGMVVLANPTPKHISDILTAPTGIIAAYSDVLSRSGFIVTFSAQAIDLIAEFACETESYSRGAKMIVSTALQDLLLNDDGKGGLVQIGRSAVQRAIDSMSVGPDGGMGSSGEPAGSAVETDAGMAGGG